ncbi:MAG: hypothetical protein Kow00109_27430 [Acidobacteriota bacterium]
MAVRGAVRYGRPVAIAVFGLMIAGLWAAGVPARPIQLEAKVEYEGAESIAVLKWRDMSDNELGFEILRSDNGGEFRVVGTVGANTTRYRDRVGKYVAGAFTYKVRAFNEAGRSEESNTASVWF